MAFYDHKNCTFEIIHFNQTECDELNGQSDLSYAESGYTPGYYWWFSMPGCLPDSEPYGPYETDEHALIDAEQTIETYYA